MKQFFKLKQKDKLHLKKYIKNRNKSSQEMTYAYILLALEKGKTQENIQDYYEVSRSTVWRVKKRYMQHGLIKALLSDSIRGKPKRYETSDENKLVQLARSQPPHGKKRWTLELLRNSITKSENSKIFNRETIRLILKNKDIILK
jgi:transposase